MKRVAVFSDGWKRLITYAWIDGMLTYISENEEEICLYQFNSHGNWSLDEKHNHGEYNIYSLPDLSYFDGIILDSTNILDKQYFDYLVDIVRKADKPTISIGNYIDGFYFAGVDNKRAITEIMSHLHEVHNCNRFIFAGGPVENYENALRIEAYLECLDRFGLSREENPVWYGDYDFSTGVRYFKEFFSSFKDREVQFPDVFVCANDNIASGLCFEAQKHGYEIPRDFKVTGFDNLDKAIFFKPQISTVEHMREEIGKKTLKVFSDIWAGKDMERNQYMESTCIFTESCGCPNCGLLDYRDFARDQIISKVDALKKEEQLIKFESNIIKCESFEEVFTYVSEFFMGLECDGFSLVIDRRLLSGDDDCVFPINGFDKENLVVAYASDRTKILDMKDVNELLRYYDACGSGNAYMFSPIHFRDKTVGYSILKNGKFLYDTPYFYDIHSAITKTLESLYRNLQLKNANKALYQIYNMDPLTGLYNRIAYNEMIKPEYYKYCKAKKRCVFAFVDADDFKQVNDVYGHEKGDIILKKIADILSENCPKDGYVYRFGGDEFIAFFPILEEDDAKSYKAQIESVLQEQNIKVSIGITITDPSSENDADYYLKMADMNMYKEKGLKKEKNNNDN